MWYVVTAAFMAPGKEPALLTAGAIVTLNPVLWYVGDGALSVQGRCREHLLWTCRSGIGGARTPHGSDSSMAFPCLHFLRYKIR